MKYKKLGKDLQISAIGLGGMPLSLKGRPSESEAIAVIHKTLDLGVTLIDAVPNRSMCGNITRQTPITRSRKL